jgi:hypothetical protein
MKKTSETPTASKAAKAPTQNPASLSLAEGEDGKAVLNKQPPQIQQAAASNGMFLYTDDAWSLRYFDQNDLHFKEREVFG